MIHGAVWTTDGEIAYRAGRGGEWAFRVAPAGDTAESVEVIDRVPAYSMNTLIDKLAPAGSVDYVKMDVEGAEGDILVEAESWASRVRCIKIEIHGGVDLAACEAKLRQLGFSTESQMTMPATLMGTKPS